MNIDSACQFALARHDTLKGAVSGHEYHPCQCDGDEDFDQCETAVIFHRFLEYTVHRDSAYRGFRNLRIHHDILKINQLYVLCTFSVHLFFIRIKDNLYECRDTASHLDRCREFPEIPWTVDENPVHESGEP